MALKQEKPFLIVYPEGSEKKRVFNNPNIPLDDELYEIVEEHQVPTLLAETHIQVEIMLETDNDIDAFLILKRMELLIEVGR